MKNLRFSKRLFAIIMSIIITGNVSFTANAWFSASPLENPPAIASFAKNESCGAVINFSADDFAKRTSAGANLDGIVITALPQNSDGVLFLGSREVLNYEGITKDDIQNLRFVPTNGDSLNSSFTFIPVFEGSKGIANSAVVKINLSTSNGTAPIAENLAFETYKNVSICGKFKASDAEGGKLVYQILDQPKYAQVVVENDGFRYTPIKDKSGKDSFTYVATDSSGNTSDAATITVKINKRSERAAITYSDMENSTVHYAAIRLSELGIMKGEQIGTSHFFNPNKPVTRGEFVAMAVLAANLDIPNLNINTGLYDDGSIPTWVKPYVSAALNAEIITGAIDKDGNHVFLSNNAITRAEAAVILNNIAKVSSGGRQVSFTDAEEIPTWASQAVISLDAVDILSADSSGFIRPCEAITREDAAQMLFDTINLIHQKDNPSQFTWLKA